MIFFILFYYFPLIFYKTNIFILFYLLMYWVRFRDAYTTQVIWKFKGKCEGC